MCCACAWLPTLKTCVRVSEYVYTSPLKCSAHPPRQLHHSPYAVRKYRTDVLVRLYCVCVCVSMRMCLLCVGCKWRGHALRPKQWNEMDKSTRVEFGPTQRAVYNRTWMCVCVCGRHSAESLPAAHQNTTLNDIIMWKTNFPDNNVDFLCKVSHAPQRGGTFHSFIWPTRRTQTDRSREFVRCAFNRCVSASDARFWVLMFQSANAVVNQLLLIRTGHAVIIWRMESIKFSL